MLLLQEAWEYIGSTRLLWDMQRDDFPYKPRNDDVGMARIHPSKISHYLELSQLGRDVDGKLFLHTDPVTRGNATTNVEV